jgi:hypothetical protein
MGIHLYTQIMDAGGRGRPYGLRRVKCLNGVTDRPYNLHGLGGHPVMLASPLRKLLVSPKLTASHVLYHQTSIGASHQLAAVFVLLNY